MQTYTACTFKGQDNDASTIVSFSDTKTLFQYSNASITQ